MGQKIKHIEKQYITKRTLLLLGKSNFFVSILYLFALFLVFYSVWSSAYYYFLEKYDINFSLTPNETIMTVRFGRQIFEVVILVPLIETLIFQKWAYQLLSLVGWLKRRKILIILLGATLFGLIHFYSLSYIIYNFFIGALLMFSFIIRIGKTPYLTVVVLHGLMNLFSILIDDVEKIIFNAV